MYRFLPIFAIALIAQPAAAQNSANATISTVWVNEAAFGVVTDQRILNPAQCTATDSYMVQKESPAYNAFYSAALSAYTVNSQVTITIHQTECADTRPKIIGMNLHRAAGDLVGVVNTMAGQAARTDSRMGEIAALANNINRQTNIVAQRTEQQMAQGNTMAAKLEKIDQETLGIGRQMRHPSGITLIALVGLIAAKLGVIN